MSFDFLKDPSFYILAVCIFILVILVVKIIVVNKKLLGITLSYIAIFLVLYALRWFFDWAIKPLEYLSTWGVLIVVVICNSDIRLSIDSLLDIDARRKVVMGSNKTKNSIIEAALKLAESRTGALMTIEKHLSLDQYSTRAIPLNADVTTELLLQIFITNTPLHDGAVIIRGDKIICAGAYFILSENKNFDSSTTGSRHRAALGISEVTDSLTILVSEETGDIEATLNGIQIKMFNKDMLDEYLTSFME
ncbi:MAG: diadenylate cyclase [Acholeplasmatales bacterium]|jgi:diadenylate cyclase|nr:diadenylate cyclase [Acholeplasmatales bacterium]